MYLLFFGITLLNQFRPYFRKYISDTLDHHEFFLLSAIMILFVITLYIIHLIHISGHTSMSTLMGNMAKLSYIEVFAVFILSTFTVISGLLIFELDKNHNNPLVNSIILKALSMIAVVCVGVFVFEEKYKMHQVLGVGLIILGIFLASKKKL
jgi:drug/metabolite transporter (DMT)-like permease